MLRGEVPEAAFHGVPIGDSLARVALAGPIDRQGSRPVRKPRIDGRASARRESGTGAARGGPRDGQGGPMRDDCDPATTRSLCPAIVTVRA